jgi:hypothetical protein
MGSIADEEVAVQCGSKMGTLLVHKCVIRLDNGEEFSPNDFEKLGGNGKANKWRKNITVGSVPLGDWLAACNIEYCRAMTVKVLDVDRPCTTAPPTAAVHCGEKTGLLLVYKIIIRLADGKEVSLNAFEGLGGKETSKKWRTHIKVGSVPLGDWLAQHNIDYRLATIATVTAQDANEQGAVLGAAPTAKLHAQPSSNRGARGFGPTPSQQHVTSVRACLILSILLRGL